jgi:hypothetical protein
MAKPLSAYTARTAATMVLICPRIMSAPGVRQPAQLRFSRLNERLIRTPGTVEAAGRDAGPRAGIGE